MKLQILIIFILLFNIGNIFGAEVVELSSRTGIKITKESRDYFGLFPKIDNFQNAELLNESDSLFFKIQDDGQEIFIPISKNTFNALREIINNFEDVLINPKDYSSFASSIIGFIKIDVGINKSAKKFQLNLKNGKNFHEFVIYVNDILLITTPDSIYNRNTANLTLIPIEDLYSISEVTFPIVDGCKILFKENVKKISEYSLFSSNNNSNVAPPEVVSFIRNNYINKISNNECNLNIDSLYPQKVSVSVDFSLQRFIMDKFIAINGDGNFNYFSLDNYYSTGLNFDYALNQNFKFRLGYNLELIYYHFYKDDAVYKYDDEINSQFNKLIGNALTFQVFYKIYSKNNFYSGIFTGITVRKYFLFDKSGMINIYNNLLKYEIVNKPKISFKSGLEFKYKFGIKSFIDISTFLQYHNDLGIVISKDRSAHTRYVNYLFSLGLSLGYGEDYYISRSIK